MIDASKYQIAGQQGDDRFLLTPAGRAVNVWTADCRILDLSQGKLFPGGTSLQTILAQGYWEPYSGSQDRLVDLLRQVGETVSVPTA